MRHSEGFSSHNPLYERETMLVNADARNWYSHPGMTIMMPDSDRAALLREIPGIPLPPSSLIARQALRHLDSLPSEMSRVEMFDGVTKYLYSIADRSGDIHHGSGAFMFADHFRKQRLFMGGAIDDVQEAEYVAQNPGLVDLSRYGSLSEAETLYYSSAVLEYKKVGRLEKEPSQDAILVDNLNGIYGVFDGMGGQGGNPAAAAHAARDAIERALSEAPQQQSISHMLEIAKSAFVEARAAVIERGEGGSTTATTAWRTSLNGQNYWVVANAGDSRSFLYDKSTHTYESLSSNQGRGSMVYNFFEYSVFDRFHEQSDEFMVIPFDTRHRLMLCSDGITGDSESEFLTDEEFLDAFSQTNASDAAALFVDYSIKVDDKSIIIIDSELDDHA